MPEASVDLPIVRLADVENNPDLVRAEPEYMSDGVDWGNRLTYDWSPLAPVQYETDETGLIPGKLWDGESGEYSPAIHTQVYQLMIPAMADDLVSDLIERYSYENTQEEFEEKKHPDLDQLIVHLEENTKEVFAAKGKTVMHVRYHGYADINSVIENVVEKMTALSE